jgi:acyl carrier protein
MTMTTEEIALRLLRFLSAAFGSRARGPIRASTPLFSAQVVDSMGVIELLAFIQREFGLAWDVTVPELVQHDTVAALAEAIARARAGPAAG